MEAGWALAAGWALWEAADTAEPALLRGAEPWVRWERTPLRHWL